MNLQTTEARQRHRATALALACAWTLASGAGAREIEPPGDRFGYRLADAASGECPYQYIDIAASGTPLTPVAAGSAPAMDDGAAVLPLARPFRFYGQPVARLVVSTNGYLAAAEGIEQEDGGDFSNDCPLPAVPGITPGTSGVGVGARILAFHDDLTGTGAGAALLVRPFADCPRPGRDGPEPCTVVQWHGFAPVGLAEDRLEFQALLYHASNDIVVQFADADDGGGGGASIGIQDAQAADGLTLACGWPGAVGPGSAACFRHPRRRVSLAPVEATVPLGGDHPLVATLTDTQGRPVAGEPIGVRVLDGPHAGLEASGASDAAGQFTLTLPEDGGEADRTDRMRAYAQDSGAQVVSPLAAATWGQTNPLLVQPASIGSRQDPGVRYRQVLVLTNTGDGDLGIEGAYGSTDGCRGEAVPPWLRIAPAAATIHPGATIEVPVTLDSSGLAAGEYRASVCIAGDPQFPATEVPARLTVLAADACARADFNGDRTVNALDYRIALANFRKAVPPFTRGDTDGDGDVDGYDLSLVRNCNGRVLP